MAEYLPPNEEWKSSGLKWIVRIFRRINISALPRQVRRWKTKARFKNTVLMKSTLWSQTKDSDSLRTLNARRSIPHPSSKEQLEALASKIVVQLDKLIGQSILEHKSTAFSDNIYQIYLYNIKPEKNRENQKIFEIETLRKQKKKLRKLMKSATKEYKNVLQEMRQGLKARHSALSRAQSVRKRRCQK